MIDRSKKLPAFFYESAHGNRPVREWFVGLSLGGSQIGRSGHSEGRIRLAPRHALLSQSRQRPVGGTERPNQSDGGRAPGAKAAAVKIEFLPRAEADIIRQFRYYLVEQEAPMRRSPGALCRGTDTPSVRCCGIVCGRSSSRAVSLHQSRPPQPGFRPPGHRCTLPKAARLKSHMAANASGFLQVAVSKAPRSSACRQTRTYVAGALPIQP